MDGVMPIAFTRGKDKPKLKADKPKKIKKTKKLKKTFSIFYTSKY
jgi:hypothetical protein